MVIIYIIYVSLKHNMQKVVHKFLVLIPSDFLVLISLSLSLPSLSFNFLSNGGYAPLDCLLTVFAEGFTLKGCVLFSSKTTVVSPGYLHTDLLHKTTLVTKQ